MTSSGSSDLATRGKKPCRRARATAGRASPSALRRDAPTCYTSVVRVPSWLEKGVARAKRILAREPALAAVYLYGSALKTPRYGDVDVAFLMGPSRRRPADSRLNAIALELDKAFGAQTDVHLLNELPDPLRHRVIRDGLRILTLDPLAAIRFESETLIRFLDFKPTFEFLTDRILSRGGRG